MFLGRKFIFVPIFCLIFLSIVAKKCDNDRSDSDESSSWDTSEESISSSSKQCKDDDCDDSDESDDDDDSIDWDTSEEVPPEHAALNRERVLPSEKLRKIAGSNSPQKVPRFPPGTAPGDPTIRKPTHPNIRDTCKKPSPVESTKDVEKPTPDIAEGCTSVGGPKIRQAHTPLQILAEELSASDSESEASSEDIDVSDAGTQCFLPWGFTLEQIDQFLSELPREHALIYKYQLEVLFFAIASKAHPYQPPNPYSAVKLPKARAPPKPKVPPKPSFDATPEVQQKTPPKKPTAKPPAKITAKTTAKD
uniref:Putative secreted protein n=1 Tax=Lutzomyia longipalpis TaxID=7200 RepID=A0A1B0CFA0_LUTLO